MFGKILSSVGIGGAKVDAQVHSGPVTPGGVIEGEVVVKGGKLDQQIERITMVLTTTYERERLNEEGTQHVTHELAGFIICDDFTIRAGEEKVIPFGIDVPHETPISTPRQRVYISTALGIAKALDPSDRDLIEVLPDPIVGEVLAQAEALGFVHSHDSGRCKFFPSDELPFVQEFELKPRSGPFARAIDELELFFEVYPEGVEMFAQVDRRARGFSGFFDEAFDLDERYVRVAIDRGDGWPEGELETFLRHVLSER